MFVCIRVYVSCDTSDTVCGVFVCIRVYVSCDTSDTVCGVFVCMNSMLSLLNLCLALTPNRIPLGNKDYITKRIHSSSINHQIVRSVSK